MNHSVAEVTVPVIQLVPCKCNMRLHDWYGGYAGLPLCEECLGIGNRFLYLGYRSSSQANALAFGTLLSGASVPVLKSNCSSYWKQGENNSRDQTEVRPRTAEFQVTLGTLFKCCSAILWLNKVKWQARNKSNKSVSLYHSIIDQINTDPLKPKIILITGEKTTIFWQHISAALAYTSTKQYAFIDE